MPEKYAFVNACNSLDGDDFINGSAQYLQTIQTKDELNDFITALDKIFTTKRIIAGQAITNFCLLFRSKAYEILLAQGHVPECDIINIYNYFSLCELEPDARFEAYEAFVDSNIYADGVSDMDRIYLVTLRFFVSFVNSKKYAFEKFLSSLSLLDFMEANQISLSPIIINFVNSCPESAEYIIGIMGKNWVKEFYFSIGKLQRRSTFNWDFHCIWGVEKCHSHPLWTSFYPLWKEILFEHVKRDECDEAMYVHFFIYHKMGNSFQTQEEWRVFNAEISQPMVKYYQEWANKNNIAKVKNKIEKRVGSKIIIGFLQDRLVENSPYKVQYSLWKELMSSKDFKERYEIRIYLMSYFEKSHNEESCIGAVESLGISVWDGAIPFYQEGVNHSHLLKALYIRNKIIEDGVDILISPNNGYDISDFLTAVRSAPKQIFWSHGNFQYDIDGIDERISHCFVENSEYGFKNFSIPMDTDRFHNPLIDQNILSVERSKYPKNVFILGTIGRLLKVDSDEYLQTIAEIMRQNPNTIYIAAGTGNEDIIRQKVEKLGITDRFYIPGWVDPHVYGHIIDLCLNTFPLEQGESANELMAKGKCVITLKGHSYWSVLPENIDEINIKTQNTYALEDNKLAQVLNQLRGQGFNVPRFMLPSTIDEYIKTCNILIRDSSLLNLIMKYILHWNLGSNKKLITEFQAKFLKMIKTWTS